MIRLAVTCAGCGGQLAFAGVQEVYDSGRACESAGLGPSVRLLRQRVACVDCGRVEKLTVTLTPDVGWAVEAVA